MSRWEAMREKLLWPQRCHHRVHGKEKGGCLLTRCIFRNGVEEDVVSGL